MKSEKSSKLISQLVDANWEIKEHRENKIGSPNFFADHLLLVKKYKQIENELIEEMGQDEYDHFIEMGRKMFATN